MNHKLVAYSLAAIAFLTVLALVGMMSVENALAETMDSIIYVDVDATGNNDGTSWDDAFTDLQPAMEASAEGDQVWVAAGTYLPTAEHCGAGERYKSFQLKNGVAVYGGFDPSVGDIDWEDRDWEGNATVLSGEIGTPGDNSDNSYHVFCHPAGLNLDSSAVLDGIMVQDGNANSDISPLGGGGMYNESSSPSLTNVTFNDNSAISGGGMRNASNSSPILSNVTFSSNISTGSAGGMSNSYSAPTLINVTFTGNTAAKEGGGMYNSFCSPSLTNVIFSGNTATWDGGGMCNYFSSPKLSNVTISNNIAGWVGGGIYNISASPNLTNVTFSGNTAGYGGSGIDNNGSSPMLTNVTFYGNSASESGGGIFNNYSSFPTLTNCILWGNLPYQIVGDPAIVSYSDIQGGYDGVGNIDTDPLLDPLADNGGFVMTHALGAASSAIDAGNPDPITCPVTDARGVSRPIDGNYDGVAVCDIGSFEFEHGIALKPTDQSGFGVPGATFDYPLGLYNFTNLTDTYTLTLGIHNWETSLSMDILGPLDPGTSQTFTASVTIPADAPWYLTDTIIVTATSVTSPTVFSASAQITTQAYTPPQISIDPLSLQSSQDVGQVVTQTLTISNGEGVTLTYEIYEGVTPDTLLLLNLDEPVGSNIFNDSSIMNNDGSCTGDSCPISGVPGHAYQAVQFDGIDDYIQTPTNGFPTGFADRTMAAWVKINSFVSPQTFFVGYGNFGTDNQTYDLITGDTTLCFQAWGTDLCGPDLQTGIWYHVAVTNVADLVTLYLDGIPVAASYMYLATPIGTQFAIGRIPGDNGIERRLNGLVDEVFVMDRALSSDEIMVIYQGGLSGDAPWLSVDPVSGSVPTDGSSLVQVTFDATGLQPNINTTTLYVVSNDPLTPIVEIPVTLTVNAVPPESATITGPEAGLVGESLDFVTSVQPISTTLPLNYVWEADGQVPITHTNGLTDTVSYTCDIPGTQLITVTASNQAGSVTDTHVISITDQPIEGLTVSNDSPTLLGEATTFTATITNGTNVSYTWDFGDDLNGTGATITHTYTIPGVYTATVTATNSVGSLTETTLVSITTPNYPIYLPLIIKSDIGILTPIHHSFLVGGGALMGLTILGIIGMWKRKG
jgi:hypothetical protein